MPKHRSPNVLIFFTDQQRWDASGLHGNPLGLMPHSDRLARKHTHVAHSFTCQPVCGPARACLQTGQYATSNGVVENGYPLPEGRPTLAECFNAAGYHTAYFGKWHLATGGKGPVDPDQRGGYRHWLAANLLEFVSMPYRTTVYDNGGEAVHLPGYRVDALTDATLRHIDRHCRERPDQPFMTMLSILEPHHQNTTGDYTPPDGYREPYTGRWKYAVVSDASIKDVGPSPDTYREAELYDLEHDPYELTNLAGMESHAAVAERMRQRLLRRIREIEGAEPEITPAEPVPSGQKSVEAREIDQ